MKKTGFMEIVTIELRDINNSEKIIKEFFSTASACAWLGVQGIPQYKPKTKKFSIVTRNNKEKNKYYINIIRKFQ